MVCGVGWGGLKLMSIRWDSVKWTVLTLSSC